MHSLGTRLRMARMSSGMTIRRLAAELGVCHSTLGHWETGRHTPTYRMLYRIAMMTGVDAVWMFGGDGVDPSTTKKQSVSQKGMEILDPEVLRRVEGGNSLWSGWPRGHLVAWDGDGVARVEVIR